ncbi:hypothetical protein AAE478_005727 [Parahypoxylon ruwenzoriense]
MADPHPPGRIIIRRSRADGISQNASVSSLDSFYQRDGAILSHNEMRGANPAYTSEELSEEFSKWMNSNSFVARLTSTSFPPWLNLPIRQLRMALEEPPVKGAAMGCRVWPATAWIIHCEDPIFKDINSKEELDENTAR